MLPLNLRSKALRRNLACSIVREPECVGDGFAEEGITEREQDEPKRRVRNMMVLVADAELGDQVPDGFEDAAERIAIARQDHPGREGAGAAFAESVERHVGNVASVGFTGAGLLDGRCDLAVDPVGHESRQLGLEARRRAEVMKEIGVGLPDFRSNCLQRHGLRAVREQDAAGGFERGGAAFFRAEAFASY